MLSNLYSGLYRAGLVTAKDCRIQLLSPLLMVFVIGMPLAMVCLTGVAFKGFEPHGIDTTVAVVDREHGALGENMDAVLRSWDESAATVADQKGHGHGVGVHVHFVQEKQLDEKDAEGRILAGQLGGALFLTHSAPPRLMVGPGEDLERFAVVSTVDRLILRTQERSRLPSDAAVPPPTCQVVPVEGEPARAAGFSSFAQAIAGNGVLFILLNCIMNGAMGLIRERRLHTLDRLLIAPLSRSNVLLGKILAVYLLGVIQAVVVFGFGWLIGVKLGDVFGLALVTLAFVLVGCSLGVAISAIARREESVQLFGSPIGLVMTALGGGMFPVEMGPTWMQRVALLFPTGWAMQAYHRLMSDGVSWLAVLPNVLVLVAFASVFFLIGVRSLRWE